MKATLSLWIIVFCTWHLSAQTWPGQTGNGVGYSNCPVSPGLNSTPCGTITSGSSGAPTEIKNCTFSSAQSVSQNFVWFENVDFNSGTGGLNISGSNNLFWCSRMQSNQIQFYNVQDTGSNNVFLYDSFVPLASLYTAPPGYTWPSAASGGNTTTQTDNVNAVAVNDGYEFGINFSAATGATWVDSSDFWGFGNALVFFGSTAQMTVTNNQIHDAAQASGVTGGNYHTDGPGYLNGGTGPNNVLIQGNVVASLGNTNGLAFQAATAGYSGINVLGNYWSGFGFTLSPGDIGTAHFTNSYLAFNQYGTDVEPIFGIFHGTTLGTNTDWNCNKLAFRSGTTWTAGGWTPASSDNGKYWLMNNATPGSTTDNGSNTVCLQPNPYSLDFGGEPVSATSVAKSITFSCNNTGGCSSMAFSLVTGTQFSISSNSCGATVSAGSSCTVSITFTPTSKAVMTDSLTVASNMPAPANSFTIPLIGVGGLPAASTAVPSLPTPSILVSEIRNAFPNSSTDRQSQRSQWAAWQSH